MKKSILPMLGFLALVSLTACYKADETIYTPVPKEEIHIGVLLPLTGSGISTGQGMQASIELARQDITQYLETIGDNATLVVDVVDTKTDTAEALVQLKSLYNRGIRMILGPYSSAELAHIRTFADANGMVVVSPSSVAVSLAIPGDNIFRLVTTDIIQGKAMSALLSEDKIKVIIPFIRDDVWGNDLLEATSGDFKKSGGMVLPPVKYAPGLTSFSEKLLELDNVVAGELAHHNPNDLAVYMLSFAEGAQILNAAKQFPNLNNIYWYGSSAFAQNAAVLADTNAALFAYTHGLPCPAFGLDEGARMNWVPLRERLQSVLGRMPDVYAYTTYDALWVLIRTSRSAGKNATVTNFKSTLVAEAANYFGVSGNTRLDSCGDRESGNYDFWAIKSDTSGYKWKCIARYNSLTGSIIRQVK